MSVQDIILKQIGAGTVLSISGGRRINIPNGIDLPVSSGMTVRIELTPNDTYTVTRFFMRAGKVFNHGVREDVYCENLSEVAYRAGMFKSYPKFEW